MAPQLRRSVAVLILTVFAGIGAEPTVEELMARLTQSVLVDVDIEEPYQGPGQAAHYQGPDQGRHSDVGSTEEAVKARFVKKGGKPKKLRRVSDSSSSGAAATAQQQASIAMAQQLRSFRNGDGTMDAEGLRKAANLLGLGPEFTDDIEAHVRSTDWNGDGKISVRAAAPCSLLAQLA